MIYFTKISTPIGQISLVRNEDPLLSILLPNNKLNSSLVQDLYPNQEIIETDRGFDNIILQLREYFSGSRKQFDIDYELNIPSFYKLALNEVANVPYGKTETYGGIAKKINNPKASRAVGTANAKNPLPILIPCHRILASNGKLGGYSGGLDMKKQLLNLENSNN